MATTTETVDFPTQLTAGVTIRWKRSYSNYPASSWTYTFYLAGPTNLSIQATASVNDFILTITAQQASTLKEGTYRYTEIVSKDNVKYEVGRGVMPVQLDLSATAPTEAQTHAEKILAIIEAKLEGRVTDDFESYEFGGGTVGKIPIHELMRLRGIYASIVWRQRNPGKMGPSVEVAFGIEK